MALDVGAAAPDFTLRNQHGEDIGLSSFRGRSNVLLVFFPFAFSGVCTGELQEIQRHLGELTVGGTEVLAVSCDHVFSNRAFSDRDGYSFSILSDFWPHGQVSRAFGTFNDAVGAPSRGSYIIDTAGVLRWKVEHNLSEARDLGAYREALAALG